MTESQTAELFNKKNGFSIKTRLKSFHYAFKGILFLLRTQHNAWIHAVLTVLVCLAGWLFHINADDWRWLIICIAMVWVSEAMNTAIEYLCDLVSPEFNTAVEKAKDIGAGAVLICALGAALVGGITFFPYLT